MTGPQSLTALDEATALLLAGIATVAPCSLPLGEAIGCVLAAPLVAPAPAPPCSVARWDGWAIGAADTFGAGPYAPAVLPMPPLLLQPGDALPQGTDAVLPPPDLLRDGPLAQVLNAVAPGTGVRAAGEDAAAGTPLRRRGMRPAAGLGRRRGGHARRHCDRSPLCGPPGHTGARPSWTSACARHWPMRWTVTPSCAWLRPAEWLGRQ
jgi:hypothetical protein